MKMLVKLEKNPNVSLHSEVEEDKGKGKRCLKRTLNKCIDLNKESTQHHNQKEQALSPVPKLPDEKRGCKIPQNVHKCAYNEQGEATLQSVADAICHLNGMVKISYATSF